MYIFVNMYIYPAICVLESYAYKQGTQSYYKAKYLNLTLICGDIAKEGQKSGFIRMILTKHDFYIFWEKIIITN